MLRELDSGARVSLERVTDSRHRNAYADLPSIKRLAEAAVAIPELFHAFGTLVAVQAVTHGYSKSVCRQLRTRALLICRDLSKAKRLIESLEAVCKDFADEERKGSRRRDEIAGEFSSAVSEALVSLLLRHGGRRDADITPDATVWIQGDRVNNSNIDFVWALTQEKVAEAYECKNRPCKLTMRYATRHEPGNRLEWERGQLHMMLQLHAALSSASWAVHLGCVTLRERSAVMLDVADAGGCPPELRIYGKGDILRSLSAPLQRRQ